MYNTRRIYFFDEIRGLSIILMVIYHIFFSMTSFFNIGIGEDLYCLFSPLQPFVAGVFVFISGICSFFSRSNLKRGLKLLIVSIAVTLVTYFAMPSQVIAFGILHMLSVSILLFALSRKLLAKIPIAVGMIIFFVLFMLTYSVEVGYIGLFSFKLIGLPKSLYTTDFLFCLGFHTSHFISSDYFSLLPWSFLFFCATFVGRLITQKKLPPFLCNRHSKFLCFAGRHSLLIYILHQPIILGVLSLIDYIF